jgi:hypothetical protein
MKEISPFYKFITRLHKTFFQKIKKFWHCPLIEKGLKKYHKDRNEIQQYIIETSHTTYCIKLLSRIRGLRD